MTSTDDGALVARIIRASLAHRAVLLFAALVLAVLGVHAIRSMPIDALPDLSDVQVIVRTSFPGQAPQIVEDQVTFPLTSALLAVPGATAVRGYSLYGDSLINVIFAEGTDPYAARTRVLEYLAQVTPRLPANARVALGPDATGVGWIYEYALVDRSGQHDMAALRTLQDWRLRFDLQSIAGIAEVATVGGMVPQYQVIVDPQRLLSHGTTLQQVRAAIAAGNLETGGAAIEMAEAEYLIRATGYIRGIDDLRRIPLKVGSAAAVTLGDVADVRIGPQTRRGIVDLDGVGEVVGGIVVMRYGANPREIVRAVQQRLQALQPTLPPGVEIVETYNRADLVDRSIDTLRLRLLEECAIVLLVCFAFLLHAGSAGVIVVTLPLAILTAFAAMRWQGLSANIMSLGGIAIAIGALVDAAIVMVENVHRKLEQQPSDAAQRLQAVIRGCVEVGPTLFVTLLIVAISFVPVLVLQGQEGRLFTPLALTKTYAMLAAALLSITVVPVLIWYFLRGEIRPEASNPLNRALAAAYRPVLSLALRQPVQLLVIVSVIVLVTLWPASRLGSEFMPQMDEGDLLYMPMTLPAISPDAARSLLQQTDRLIRAMPEVERVFGKAGRADTATDPAPLEMIETVIRLKPRDQWRPGMTLEGIQRELDQRLQLPGLANTWSAPIKSRIDMLSTGVRAPVAAQIFGPDLASIEAIGGRIAPLLREVPGVRSVYVERASTGRYIDIDVDRARAARFGLNIADVHAVIELAVGGAVISEAVAGRVRYPIIVRYPDAWRDSLEKLRDLPLLGPRGERLTLGEVATVRIADGPSVVRSEDAQPVGAVLVDIDSDDVGGFVAEANARIQSATGLPPGYSLRWTGQYEHLQRAMERMRLVIPLTLVVIVAMLYLNFRRLDDVLLILGALPAALVGGVWLMWALGYPMNVASAIGFIALGGLAAETGVVMLLYLNQAWQRRCAAVAAPTPQDLHEAIVEGALLRLRPKLMTVFTLLAGLLPIMIGGGAGSEFMRRIAAPMVGGIVSSTVLTLIAVPALFWLRHRRETSS
ncbi:MAG TPA: CusA/CzcA family heavy metal efflux RND transporter [Steroidobacteraceae bacterium]|nr:CusA/CzcA family heavy metal efflux RND transporter [Steroidobacteraceae bacterium]